MERIDIFDAETRFSQLLHKAAAGEDIVITRNGIPLARMTAFTPSKRRIRFGVLKGKLTIPPDFDDPLPEAW